MNHKTFVQGQWKHQTMSGKTLFEKSIRVFAGILVTLSIGALSGCKHLDSEQTSPKKQFGELSPAQTLITYDSVYAHGLVGFFGHMTRAEMALRIIYRQKDAALVLAGLYPKCHPVGKAYLLSALWYLDTNRFHILSEDFMKGAGKITTMSGDVGRKSSREELIRGMQYQTSVFAFSPGKVSDVARKQDETRKLRDTEELLSHDPYWSGIKSAFIVKEIWDVDDSAVITVATNVPLRREIRLRITAPWHDGKITIGSSPSRLLAAVADLTQSKALDGVSKSKRITIWGTGDHLFEERDIRPDLEKAMAFQTGISEWIEVVITDWNPDGWESNYLKLFHQLHTDIWLNQEDGKVWDLKVN